MMKSENFIQFLNQSLLIDQHQIYRKENHFHCQKGKGYKKVSEDKIVKMISEYLDNHPVLASDSCSSIQVILTPISTKAPKKKGIAKILSFLDKVKNFILFRGYQTSHSIIQKKALELLKRLPSDPQFKPSQKRKKITHKHNQWDRKRIQTPLGKKSPSFKSEPKISE